MKEQFKGRRKECNRKLREREGERKGETERDCVFALKIDEVVKECVKGKKKQRNNM